ncbi:MAG TPA: DEAD/DEAH box helicase [Alphaproteobacteria bacterium]|nr:DEAD/DEAH box helicase [Alphaproteobacteria bacterium]
MTQSFLEIGLRTELQRALADSNYANPTPIQSQAIPHLLNGRDLLGIAQTGTGKTAAFALPILQRLAAAAAKPRPAETRALILTPTRELAIQIGDSFKRYGAHLGLRHTVIFGGVGQNPQVEAMRRGVDILVATPGRLLDLMNQGHIRLAHLEVFVLDEADRMLDMGFIHDVRKVVAALPKQRQTLLFSATMPAEIADLAARLLKEPVRIEVTPQATTVERIDQKVLFAPVADKRRVLVDLLRDPVMNRTIAFTRTKHGANRVAEHLEKAGIAAAAIHGNKSQSARQAALAAFRAGKLRVLVATDIAARGIDIDGVSHVVNFDLPNEPETYVHRIGRTARAGKDGRAISLCAPDERAYLRDIEKLIRRKIDAADAPVSSRASAAPVQAPLARHAEQRRAAEPRADSQRPPSEGQRRRRRNRGNSNRGAQAQGKRAVGGAHPPN